MKNRLKGTLTEENLLKAFAGESQARNRYTFFASQAKKDGYEQIAAIFDITADQEKEHAKRLFKFMEGGIATIHNATYPAGIIGTTEQNLVAAADGEHEEWEVLYASFAETALAEGFQKIGQDEEADGVCQPSWYSICCYHRLKRARAQRSHTQEYAEWRAAGGKL